VRRGEEEEENGFRELWNAEWDDGGSGRFDGFLGGLFARNLGR
jgi:hypothetical protein